MQVKQEPCQSIIQLSAALLAHFNHVFGGDNTKELKRSCAPLYSSPSYK